MAAKIPRPILIRWGYLDGYKKPLPSPYLTAKRRKEIIDEEE